MEVKQAQFATISEEGWREALDKTLKRQMAYKELVSETLDGITINPLYKPSDGSNLSHLLAQTPPLIRQSVDDPDPERARLSMSADRDGGAEGFTLIHASAPFALASGFRAKTPNDFASLLKDLDLDYTNLRLDAGAEGLSLPLSLLASFEQQKLAPSRWHLSLAISPTATAAQLGLTLTREHWEPLYRRYQTLTDQGYKGAFFAADTRLYHAAGASEVQELALMLAEILARLREAETSGLDMADVFPRLLCLIALDADLWLNVAKLRAARLLIRRFSEVSGFAERPDPKLEADVSGRMFSRYEVMNNLLRSSLAVTAACFGGVDGLTSLAPSAPQGVPDNNARRLARNLALIARDEAGLSRVRDPLAGSGMIEHLTDSLAEKAWTLFQTIEREGGLAAWQAKGSLAETLAAMRKKRAKAIAQGKLPLIGLTLYPDLSEETSMVFVKQVPCSAEGSKGLITSRLAEPYEALRDQAQALGETARAVIIALGSPSDYLAAANLARNRLAIGGIRGEMQISSSADEALQAFEKAPAALAVLATSPALCDTEGLSLLSSLAERDQITLWCVGKAHDSLIASGISRFITRDDDHLISLARDALAAVTKPQNKEGLI